MVLKIIRCVTGEEMYNLTYSLFQNFNILSRHLNDSDNLNLAGEFLT